MTRSDLITVCGSHTDTVVLKESQVTYCGGPNVSAYEPHPAGRRTRDQDPSGRYPSRDGWFAMNFTAIITGSTAVAVRELVCNGYGAQRLHTPGTTPRRSRTTTMLPRRQAPVLAVGNRQLEPTSARSAARHAATPIAACADVGCRGGRRRCLTDVLRTSGSSAGAGSRRPGHPGQSTMSPAVVGGQAIRKGA